jgi:hypothetical protein
MLYWRQLIFGKSKMLSFGSAKKVRSEKVSTFEFESITCFSKSSEKLSIFDKSRFWSIALPG